MARIRVLVADDHVLFAEGLRQMLELESDMECVGLAVDGQEAVRLTAELLPNVVLMDIAMPKMDGIEAAKQIKAIHPKVGIIILTAYNYEHYVLASIKAGVEGYLLKNTHRSGIVGAIRAAYCGGRVFETKVASKGFLYGCEDELSGKLEALHQQELQVLKLASIGMHNKDIALKLRISENDVVMHFRHIFKRLAVKSRTEAVVRALREGWLTKEDGTTNPDAPEHT